MAQPPIPSEAAPGAPAPESAPGESQGGGKLASLMSDTFKNLSMLSELVGAAGDQAMGQKLQAIKAQFEALLDDAPSPAGPPPGSPAPMEAGGAKVRPAL